MVSIKVKKTPETMQFSSLARILRFSNFGPHVRSRVLVRVFLLLRLLPVWASSASSASAGSTPTDLE